MDIDTLERIVDSKFTVLVVLLLGISILGVGLGIVWRYAIKKDEEAKKSREQLHELSKSVVAALEQNNRAIDTNTKVTEQSIETQREVAEASRNIIYKIDFLVTNGSIRNITPN